MPHRRETLFEDLEYVDLFLEEIEMLRTFLLFVYAISLAFCITSYSSAALVDNGDGTITQIKSDGTKLMWTRNTLLAGDTALPESNKNWNEAKLWAANLDFAGYSDWRLPRTPGTITNGITTEGELGDLYHSELGDLKNPDKFKMSDKHNNVFWTETELDATTVFIVNFGNFKGKYKYSYQQTCSAEDNRQVWAVREVTDSLPASAEVTEATEATTDTEVAEVVTSTEVTTIEEVTETTAAATDTIVAEVATDAETEADAKISTETKSAETTAVTTDDEIVVEANVTTENIAVTEVIENEPVTKKADKAESTTVTDSATEAVAAKEEIAADIIVIEATTVAVAAKVEVVTESTDTTKSESAESQDVPVDARANGEREEGKITIHILNEKNIKSIYNGDCIKVFWKEQPEKDAEINLCLYGINDYKFEDNHFWISFTKGSSIKCSEVTIDIPYDVMTQDQIHTIFSIDNN